MSTLKDVAAGGSAPGEPAGEWAARGLATGTLAGGEVPAGGLLAGGTLAGGDLAGGDLAGGFLAGDLVAGDGGPAVPRWAVGIGIAALLHLGGALVL